MQQTSTNLTRKLGCALVVTCALLNASAQDVPLFHSPLFTDAVRPIVALQDGHPDTQVLAEIVVARQAAIRTALTLTNKEALFKEIGTTEFEELENFVGARPQSPWTPSLRVYILMVVNWSMDIVIRRSFLPASS
jgi:hypothetical protein